MKKVISSILTCTMMLGSIGSLSCLAVEPSISETTAVAKKALAADQKAANKEEILQSGKIETKPILDKSQSNLAALSGKDSTDEDYDNGEDSDTASEEDSSTEDTSDEEDSAAEDISDEEAITDEEDTTANSNVNYLKIAGCAAGIAAVAAGAYFGYTNRQEISDTAKKAFDTTSTYVKETAVPKTKAAWDATSTYVKETAVPKTKAAWDATSKYVEETVAPAIKAFVTTTIPAATKTVWNFVSKHTGKVSKIVSNSFIKAINDLKTEICSTDNYPNLKICSANGSAPAVGNVTPAVGNVTPAVGNGTQLACNDTQPTV